jgi:hypothetical protein
MKLDREKLRRDILWQYAEEHQALGREGTLRLLEEGREWDLAPTLGAGGVLVFPHASVADCGHQVAAVVHACLDCGAERVLVISVLHALTDEMEAAQVRVAHGSDLAMEPLRGIQGPGLPGRQDWRSDHVLTSFRHFWKAETERRGIQGPERIERFPYLAGGEPHTLPGIEELEAIARDAAIVSKAIRSITASAMAMRRTNHFSQSREGWNWRVGASRMGSHCWDRPRAMPAMRGKCSATSAVR